MDMFYLLMNCRFSYAVIQIKIAQKLNEPVHEKTNSFGFRPGLTQTGLYCHRRCLEAGNFGFRK